MEDETYAFDGAADARAEELAERAEQLGVDREDVEQVQALFKTLRETAADLLDKGVTPTGIRVNIEAVIDGEEA